MGVPIKPILYASKVSQAFNSQNGPLLASLLSTFTNTSRQENVSDLLWLGLDRNDMAGFFNKGKPVFVGDFNGFKKKLGPNWFDMIVSHTHVIIALRMEVPDLIFAYAEQVKLINLFYQWMLSCTESNGWALPLLYLLCNDLKRIATDADKFNRSNGNKAGSLEDASRLIQKCFSACLNDRSGDVYESRKMGVYYMATLLFKIYFQLHSTALCSNMHKVIKGNKALLALDQYPVSHQVSYRYYMGYFAFLNEDYVTAEKELLFCLSTLHSDSSLQNQELIQSLLIPTLLLRGVLPSPRTLVKFPRLAAIYPPFCEAFKTGNIALYDSTLIFNERALMARGTYLAVERGREGAVRALMKKAWILEGKPQQMGIGKFSKAFRAAGMEVDDEETECLLAISIKNDLMKGYISHSAQVVVLSKILPFPWYPAFRAGDEAEKLSRSTKELAERNRVVKV